MTKSAQEWGQFERETQQARIRAGRGGLGTGHPEIDRRVLEMTRLAVAKIDQDPTLVRTGLDNIERWTRQRGGYLPGCHAEWKALIEQEPWTLLREMLLAETDEGQRLRSSHPFITLVTEEERAKIYGS